MLIVFEYIHDLLKLGMSDVLLQDASWNMADLTEMETDDATGSEVKDMAPSSQLAAAAANIEAERSLRLLLQTMFSLCTM